MRLASAVILALAALLASCNDTDEQKRAAVNASKRFQDAYNTGTCQDLYNSAGQYFQKHETPSRWLQDCAELRSRFGHWSEFMPTENNGWPFGQPGIVWVRGPAKFLNGRADVRLDWDLSKDPPALFDFLIEAGGHQIAIPGFTGEIRR